MASIQSLPAELLHQVCTHLAPTELFAFGATSRLHRALSLTTLQALRLGIFPTRIHGLVSILSSPAESSSTEASSCPPINVTLPRKQSRSKDLVIKHQTRIATQVLATHGRALRDLELSLWTLEPSTAASIARLQRLQRLSIRLDHPHTRHRDLRPGFWREALPSVVWNELFGDPKTRDAAEKLLRESKASGKQMLLSPPPPPNPVFGDLRSLTLERAGITDWQLQRLLEENPRVEELRLRKCSVLTDEFFVWLASSKFAESLKVLTFEMNDGETIDERVVESLARMQGLEELSLSQCPRIPNASIKELAREGWPNLKHLALPQVEHVEAEDSIEVDPAYK